MGIEGIEGFVGIVDIVLDTGFFFSFFFFIFGGVYGYSTAHGSR